MKIRQRAIARVAILAGALLMITGMTVLMTGQEAPPPQEAITVGDVRITGIPDDWTHHRLIFSNPGTEEDAILKGTYDRWLKVTKDPRYIIQQLKRRSPARGQAAADVARILDKAAESAETARTEDLSATVAPPTPVSSKAPKATIKKDWSVGMDGTQKTETVTVAGTLSSSNITSATSLTVASVAFDASPPTAAYQTGTFAGAPTSGQTVTITAGSNVLTLTVGGAQGTGTLSVSGDPGTGTSTLTVGTVKYTFATTCGTTTNCIVRNVSGGSTSKYAGNIYAALANSTSDCTAYGTGSGCFAHMTSNTGISLGSFTAGTSTSFTVTNTTGTTLTFTSSETNVTASGSGTIAGYTGSNSCTSSTVGTFVLDSNATNVASNLATSITACQTSYSAVGVTATSSSGVVTVTATTAGTGGNSIALGEGLSNFAWTGGATSLANGTDGTTSGTSSPPTFAYWSVNTYVSSGTLATNIATAISANTTMQENSGVTASSAGSVVTLTARATGSTGFTISDSTTNPFTLAQTVAGTNGTGSVLPNAFPALWGASLTGASCADFIAYPTGQTGGTTTASIVAYTNIYANLCASSGAVPSLYWAYNTGGAITTSPDISLDGTQFAFIQVTSSKASLVLLKWAPSVGAPVTLTSQASGSAYQTCTAPCMYTMALSGSVNDTFSSPFYDYGNDILYVGDDSGKLHQFTGIFNGSPAENTTSPWPVTLTSGNKVSSPVYDSEEGFQGGYVFVGDMGGVFYGVGTGYGGTVNGQIHGNTGSLGDAIADAPLVDSSEGTEFVFVTTNGSYSYTGDNGVWEFVSSFTDLGTPGVVPVGTGGAGYYLYAGDFDNVYYGSGNPAYGHLYVVGNTGGTTAGTNLYQVGIAYSSLTGTVNTVATGLNSTEHPWPSPLTEFCNNGSSDCGITPQRNVTAKVGTTSPEITILSGSGTFSSTDVGAVVSGTDIPFGATISTVLSSTTANLSAAPTAAVTSETLAIQGGQTTSGTDYVFFSVNRGAKTGCTNAVGNGCILSYNVNNPTSVTQSGSGLNVTTPGTNGCWATGGIVIDNSDSTSGASQIYFIGLNGASSAATGSNCTSGTAGANAMQASQSNP